MKKSKAIEEIASVIRDTLSLPEESMAAAIIHKIEELGMQPPNKYQCDCDGCRDYSWEKEDS